MELKGERLQKACWLVASGAMTDEEIAKYLRVKVGTIRRYRRTPDFIQTVAKMRAIAEEHLPGVLPARVSKTIRAREA